MITRRRTNGRIKGEFMLKKILIPSLIILSASSFAATNSQEQIKLIKNIEENSPTYALNAATEATAPRIYRVLQDTLNNYYSDQQYKILLELNHNMLQQTKILEKLSQGNNAEHELKKTVLDKVEAKYNRLKLALNSNPSIQKAPSS